MAGKGANQVGAHFETTPQAAGSAIPGSRPLSDEEGPSPRRTKAYKSELSSALAQKKDCTSFGAGAIPV